VIASPDALRWPAVRERLMSQVAPDDWNTWLAPLDLLDVVDGAAVIAVPNLFVRSEVSARFETLLAAALGAELAQDLRIELVIATPAPAQWQQAHITTEALLCQV
jgi:chromosomal replication initiation ATPase DnaA